jgi:hypothetical protein
LLKVSQLITSNLSFTWTSITTWPWIFFLTFVNVIFSLSYISCSSIFPLRFCWKSVFCKLIRRTLRIYIFCRSFRPGWSLFLWFYWFRFSFFCLLVQFFITQAFVGWFKYVPYWMWLLLYQ